MFIINSIAPLFLLIAFGKLLEKIGFFPESFFKGLNKLVFWFALPALLISGISTAKLETAAIGKLILMLTLSIFAILLLAWFLARILKLPRRKYGAFIQGAFRSNGAFIGLPVILYTLAESDPRARMLGTVILAPLVILFNILGASVLLHYGEERRSSSETIRSLLIQLIRNPLIDACAIGLALNLIGWTLPTLVLRPLDALGAAALPLILMSIGASLKLEPLRGTASPALTASCIKLIASPFIGFLFALLFNLDHTERMIAIFYLAAPAAGMSYVMADVMGSDSVLAGRIVALSTLMCGLTLPIIIALGF